MSGCRRDSGFTLIETVVALTLLAVMLAMLFAGMRAGIRAWDAGSIRGDRADQVLLTESFLRREFAVAFPWRFKDPLAVKLAFQGERDRIRFVSMRPAQIGDGGLSFVVVSFEPSAVGESAGRLTMQRVFASSDAVDFASVEAAEKFSLLDGVTSARFQYFGAENDVTQPAWMDKWEYPQRMPTHIRLDLAIGDLPLPPMIVALKLGEEAGCYESSFQRTCVPRR